MSVIVGESRRPSFTSGPALTIAFALTITSYRDSWTWHRFNFIHIMCFGVQFGGGLIDSGHFRLNFSTDYDKDAQIKCSFVYCMSCRNVLMERTGGSTSSSANCSKHYTYSQSKSQPITVHHFLTLEQNAV